MNIYRQGDILIAEIKQIPRNSKKLNHRILAHGEATGHMHQLKDGDLFDIDGTLFFELAQNTDLIHQEHDTISISPGKYEVIRQKEYSPERSHYVQD